MAFDYTPVQAYIMVDSENRSGDASRKLSWDCFSKTIEAVGSYSNQNEDVKAGCQAFIDDLRAMQGRGEILEHEVARILGAIVFAAEKHQFQVRKNPDATPYIIHPVGVAHNLATIGSVRDPNILIAALLHDTVEDTNTTFEEIRSRFGEKIEGIVRELTDDKALPKEERKRLQIENAHHKSPEAAQVKLSDKLYNLTDLQRNPPADWPQERIDQYFNWAKQVVDNLPDANPALKAAVDDAIDAHWRG